MLSLGLSLQSLVHPLTEVGQITLEENKPGQVNPREQKILRLNLTLTETFWCLITLQEST